MNWLQVLAIVLHTADSVQTCEKLSNRGRELNPVLGQSCTRVVLLKTAGLTPMFVLKHGKAKKFYTIGMIGSAGIGLGITWYVNRKN